MLGARLKIMLADLGLTPESAGKMLHVHPRTVRYWISGKTHVPYAAYRLLRILTGAELPANGWEGWHMHSGMLWSPEGHGFKPNDSSWWGLLVRQARMFKTMYDRETLLKLMAIRAGDGTAANSDGREAAAVVDGEPSTESVSVMVGSLDGVKKGRNPVTPSFFPISGNFQVKSGGAK